MPVRGDLIGRDASCGLRGAEEGLGGCHVPVLAEHGVDQMAVAVDGSVQIRPAAANLQIRLIHVPFAATGAAPAVPPLPELAGQHRRELRFPVADGLVADHDAADLALSLARSRSARRRARHPGPETPTHVLSACYRVIFDSHLDT
jgi:hypothetical protein